MTKTKPKRSMTKASSNVSDTKTSTPKNEQITLIVLGYDEQQKPCAARFVGDKPELVAKAADLMDLKVYKTTTPDLAAVAKKLPVGRLYANGRGFVPNVRQALYMAVIDELGAEPKAAVSTKDDKASMPVARGLPGNWDEIAPGHLVIAQEAFGYGWWEALVIGRNDDMFTLRYRDYPKLPKFVRHRSAIGLMSPPTDPA
jgi:hypothetical protein